MRTANVLALVLTVLAGSSSWAFGAEVDYLREVKPILRARCVACHGALRQKGGLRLDAAPLIRKGATSGPVVVPGQSDESRLVEVLRGDGSLRMPPEAEGAALSEKEVALVAAWVDQGAKAPEEPIPGDPRDHWAFRPPAHTTVPAGKGPGSVGNPIDAFLAVERARHGIALNPPADRATLLRRVFLDLVGLPPTRGELHAFLADNAPDAYERVVDRLLADPRHGERWGRHWMDIWRYSDPFGLGEEYRYSQRHIWHWRDWIIEALNADKGYDRMIVEMLAGDEVAPAEPDILRATGYLARNWYKFNRNAWLQDTVEHTAAGFLGITLRCARCHDHKYDPLSQRDYYRFRAVFEPHDVRIERLSAQPDVKLDGIPRAFDAKPAEPTYLFVRGDDRSPDKDHPLSPAVPAALGGTLAIEPVQFTPRDYAQALELAADDALRQARAEIQAADAAVAKARVAADAARGLCDRFLDDPKPPLPSVAVPAVYVQDDFVKARPETWKALSGQWVWENGKLAQKSRAPFVTLATLNNHPSDLLGRLRFRTTGGGITSVGFSFDVVGATSWQAVYTYCQPGNSAVQAFHRTGGTEVYPPQGIVPIPLTLNEEINLDFAVRGTLLNVWVNGRLAIAYRLPTARQAGVFALWNHDATSEFSEVRLVALPKHVTLAESPGDARPSPFSAPFALTKDDARRAAERCEGAVGFADAKRSAALQALKAVELRIAAERAKYSEPPDARASMLALAAARAERKAAVGRAVADWLPFERDPSPNKADPKRVAAEQTLTAAKASAANEDPSYTPLARLDPATSTGRRLALARWIAGRNNPLTARVAVNHVWLRHFGNPLVPTVANFGLNGKPPTHPLLLDWLAVRFMEDGWSLKRLHRLIVTSEAYRLSSRVPTQPVDPENRYFGRMKPRRMEGELVRDSLLAVAGALDPTPGGPILDEKQGQVILRRSLYFRFNTEYKMLLLDQFDPASPTECYERHESVIPQQALALTNSALALNQARRLARRLADTLANEPQGLSPTTFVTAAFEQVLTRAPTGDERARCERFLRDQARLLEQPAHLTPFPAGPDTVAAPATDPSQRARENLIHVLFNHNDFVTVR
ncbi:MAG: PSD1 and planctomycete cytochrome C domain-containing protein [Isosphaeraceae bacterium]|nr:PSD1 and planctomycete cytochrome C domain-containing protein [Isosphaeraceae bacterium]